MNALNVRCLESYMCYWSSQLSELGIFISVLPTKLSDFFQELNSALPISRHRALLTLSHASPNFLYIHRLSVWGVWGMTLIIKLSIPYNLVHSPVIPHLRNTGRLWSSKSVIKKWSLETSLPFSGVCGIWPGKTRASLSRPQGQHGRPPVHRLPFIHRKAQQLRQGKRVCGGRRRSSIPILLFCCCCNTQHKFSSLNQHECLISRFCRSEVCPGFTGLMFLSGDLPFPVSRDHWLRTIFCIFKASSSLRPFHHHISLWRTQAEKVLLLKGSVWLDRTHLGKPIYSQILNFNHICKIPVAAQGTTYYIPKFWGLECEHLWWHYSANHNPHSNYKYNRHKQVWEQAQLTLGKCTTNLGETATCRCTSVPN